jgi:transcriptional/translational regulatory protein YebC/TACO1
MTIQKTFIRGNYTGHWLEDPNNELQQMTHEKAGSSLGRSGSLKILFKGKEEVVLYDKAEHVAEQIFAIYVEPDWHALADVMFDNYIKHGISLAKSLKIIADDERHIEHDVYMVKKILTDIFAREGFDAGDIEKELRELANE